MKRFVDSLAKQKGIKPPAGYAKSGSICRAFLDQHAPKKDPETNGGPKPASPAQMSYAEKIARDRAIIIPDEAKASSGAMSKWIESNRTKKKAKRGRKKAAPGEGGMTRRKANGGQRRLSRRITLLSLEERIDTNSAAGELVFHVFGAIAHFERRLIAERPKDGIAAARARGKWPGRQPLTFGRTHVKNLAPLAGLTHLRTLETS